MSLTFLRPRRRNVVRHVENVSMNFAGADPALIERVAICCDAVGDNEARAFGAANEARLGRCGAASHLRRLLGGARG